MRYNFSNFFNLRIKFWHRYFNLVLTLWNKGISLLPGEFYTASGSVTCYAIKVGGWLLENDLEEPTFENSRIELIRRILAIRLITDLLCRIPSTDFFFFLLYYKVQKH